ncbi:hypothetical protein D9M72_419980 [compost metagenome]
MITRMFGASAGRCDCCSRFWCRESCNVGLASLAEGVGGNGKVSCAPAMELMELASTRLSFTLKCPDSGSFWVMGGSVLVVYGTGEWGLRTRRGPHDDQIEKLVMSRASMPLAAQKAR